MTGPPLRIAFLVGSDNEPARRSIESVCQLAGVRPVAVLLDAEPVGRGRYWSKLRGNVRKHGKAYVLRRILAGLRGLSDSLVERAVVSPRDVAAVLQSAFPERCLSLAALGRKYGFDILNAGNLNHSRAAELLASLQVDLGIVIGTRILKRDIFSVPRMSCIHLHKGKVPEYRGRPPAFWELYDGAPSAGVTVHFVDDGLNTGDVIAHAEIPITPADTPDSLSEKLHQEGARVLAAAVESLQSGTAVREPQTSTRRKPRSSPTSQEIRELCRRLPHWRVPGDAAALMKNLYVLLVYYSGLYWLFRARHDLARGRACVMLYHRINDFSKDALTVGTWTFAAQLLAVSKWYKPIATAELVDRLDRREKIRPGAVVHFDDCYRDVVRNGQPILQAVGFPAAAFISSGFLDSDRAFPHDQQKSPFRYENLRASDLQAWIGSGFEVGAHTVNHMDLGQATVAEARFEVLESRRQLEALIGPGTVRFFSFPFGGTRNIRPEVVEIVRQAGYAALFSAHGGFVNSNCDIYDIPRLGASGRHRPLYLLLEMEGLMPGQLAARVLRRGRA